MWESEWVISSQCSITGLADCVRLVKFAGHPSKYLSHDLPNLAHIRIYFFPHRKKISSSSLFQQQKPIPHVLNIPSHSIDQCKLSYIFLHPFKSKHWLEWWQQHKSLLFPAESTLKNLSFRMAFAGYLLLASILCLTTHRLCFLIHSSTAGSLLLTKIQKQRRRAVPFSTEIQHYHVSVIFLNLSISLLYPNWLWWKPFHIRSFLASWRMNLISRQQTWAFIFLGCLSLSYPPQNHYLV